MDVAVVSPHTTTRMDLEIAAMLTDELRATGDTAVRVDDGDPQCLAAGMVLLVGDCLEFTQTADILAQAGTQRPRTVLWQLHALPPPDLPKEIIASGVRAADALYRIQSHGAVGRFLARIRLAVPPKARVILRSALYRGVRKQVSQSAASSRWRLDEASRQFMLMRYAWLVRQLADGWLDRLAVSTAPRAAFLSTQGMPVEYVPFGHHPLLGSAQRVTRDINVLFLGRAKIRRRQVLLERIDAALSRKGCRLHVIEGGCFGETRTSLLNRTRISINLNNYPWEVPGIRFIMSMACGALVVTESLGDVTPFGEGEHFVSAATVDLPDVVLRLLDDPVECQRLTDSARRFVTQDLTLRRSLSKLLGRSGVSMRAAAR